MPASGLGFDETRTAAERAGRMGKTSITVEVDDLEAYITGAHDHDSLHFMPHVTTVPAPQQVGRPVQQHGKTLRREGGLLLKGANLAGATFVEQLGKLDAEQQKSEVLEKLGLGGEVATAVLEKLGLAEKQVEQTSVE